MPYFLPTYLSRLRIFHSYSGTRPVRNPTETETHFSTNSETHYLAQLYLGSFQMVQYRMTSKQRWRDVTTVLLTRAIRTYCKCDRDKNTFSKNILFNLSSHLTSTFAMPISIVAVSCSNNGLMSLFTSRHALQILSNFKLRILCFPWTPAILNCSIERCSS